MSYEISRRNITKSAVWSMPVVVAAVSTPAQAASVVGVAPANISSANPFSYNSRYVKLTLASTVTIPTGETWYVLMSNNSGNWINIPFTGTTTSGTVTGWATTGNNTCWTFTNTDSTKPILNNVYHSTSVTQGNPTTWNPTVPAVGACA
ncbi:MAG: hypothetical protein QM632_06080 [Micrococcaceae bacterium]